MPVDFGELVEIRRADASRHVLLPLVQQHDVLLGSSVVCRKQLRAHGDGV
jgi:hypothetical protein